MSVSRRSLVFESLDNAVREAERLRVGGYERAGRWDLAQVCGHLAAWMRSPVEGYPRAPIPGLMWVLRQTIGKRELRRVLETGTMRPGAPTLRPTVPAAGGDEAAAVAQLREAVARFQSHAGELHASPFFGAMDREAHTRLQLVHCGHHLGFLVPKGSCEVTAIRSE